MKYIYGLLILLIIFVVLWISINELTNYNWNIPFAEFPVPKISLRIPWQKTTLKYNYSAYTRLFWQQSTYIFVPLDIYHIYINKDLDYLSVNPIIGRYINKIHDFYIYSQEIFEKIQKWINSQMTKK